MDIAKASSKLMNMSDDVWKKHANPISFWTRLFTFPFVFFAVWSHVWIGWYSLIPFTIVSIWIWLNPRIFPKPKSTKNWASHGVFGERVWMNRKNIPIPKEHEIAAKATMSLSFAGFIIFAYGMITKDFWAAFMGWNMSAICKIWFVDRMAWLYRDVKGQHKEYAEWEY